MTSLTCHDPSGLFRLSVDCQSQLRSRTADLHVKHFAATSKKIQKHKAPSEKSQKPMVPSWFHRGSIVVPPAFAGDQVTFSWKESSLWKVPVLPKVEGLMWLSPGASSWAALAKVPPMSMPKTPEPSLKLRKTWKCWRWNTLKPLETQGTHRFHRKKNWQVSFYLILSDFLWFQQK